MVLNPANSHDNLEEPRWIVGGVKRRFFVEIVPNRQINSMIDLFRRKIRACTIIKQMAIHLILLLVKILGHEHIVVNHSLGFTNSQDDHTYNIENIWYHLRDAIRCRHRVTRENIGDFLREFLFRFTFVRREDKQSVYNAFLSIVKERIKIE